MAKGAQGIGFAPLPLRQGRPLTDREVGIMTFDYCSPAELFTAKRKGGSRQRLGYRRFATAAEAIRSQWKSFPPCAPSARGCWSVTSASTARKSIACMSDDYPLGRRTG